MLRSKRFTTLGFSVLSIGLALGCRSMMDLAVRTQIEEMLKPEQATELIAELPPVREELTGGEVE